MKKRNATRESEGLTVLEILSINYSFLARNRAADSDDLGNTLQKYGFVNIRIDHEHGKAHGDSPRTPASSFFIELRGQGIKRSFVVLRCDGYTCVEVDSGHTFFITPIGSPGTNVHVSVISTSNEWMLECLVSASTNDLPPRERFEPRVDLSSLPPKAEMKRDCHDTVMAIMDVVCSQPECRVSREQLRGKCVADSEVCMARMLICYVSCHIYGQNAHYISICLGVMTSNIGYCYYTKSKERYVTDHKFKALVARVRKTVEKKLK